MARKRALKEIAYGRICGWLLDGKLRPGDPLVEPELARRLGVSRTPVREALGRLSQEGLVEIVPRRGAFVSRVNLKEIRELFEIREALESIAARNAARGGDERELAAIESMFQEAANTPDDDARRRLAEGAGDALHEYIKGHCQNDRIKQILDTNRTLLRFGQQVSASIPGEIEKSLPEHLEILRALRTKDPEAAETAMRRHVVNTLNAILESYRR